MSDVALPQPRDYYRIEKVEAENYPLVYNNLDMTHMLDVLAHVDSRRKVTKVQHIKVTVEVIDETDLWLTGKEVDA